MSIFLTSGRAAFAVLLAAVLSTSAPAFAQPRVAVPDARQLLLAAIDAPDGQAHGILTGELAEAIAQRFKATTPIHVDVSTERRYEQRGCRRLKVSFWQDGVVLPSAEAPRRQTIDFGINYCRDGMPPKSLKEAP
jgi:hypothetical protein